MKKASGTIAGFATLAALTAVSFVGGALVFGSDTRNPATQTSATPEPAPQQAAAPLDLTQPQPSPADALAAILPFGAEIGGDFDLIDHYGNPRQLKDYEGRYLLVFFGYANCEAICSTALPLMADTVTRLKKAAGDRFTPVMITVDPENDTLEVMRERLNAYHPSLIGLTGSDGALADVRNKFKVSVEKVGTDIEGRPIYNHGSFVYLLGPDGSFKTLVPPIVDADRMAEIVANYMKDDTEPSDIEQSAG
ncbi:MAG: SCO family protein [Pseudomonadota bacterium]